ncbi:diacylglycerol kinase family protein [Micromonospora sp. WMMD1102]|uniref:diacylglycerol kinase family protein n=1 Tax=Micromonospora sp. WMMD1102 TaxID=3016105 RepID=UPI0024157D4F|nr:diacylglycerol kinase family protein [Micromonospora sp. WMMD1102]MDG4787181.1 diacylglycerol kinase family protein [Micromonospora sp. WMMD1102]
MTADDQPSCPAAGRLGDGHLAVLANPTAGRGRFRGLLPAVLDRLGTVGRPVRLLEAGSVAEATAVCRAAVAEGAAALLTVGGDGTVHLALQAVAGTEVAFGPVPAGTGNDFAVGTGYPADPLGAVEVIAAAIAAGRTRPADLARMTGPDGTRRWYGAVLAAGFDALVNERANRMSWPRGPRRYDLAILVELARLRPRRYLLRLDGVTRELDGVLVAVGNCPSYGGGMRICPTADPTDGLLDVVYAGRIGRATLTRIKPRVYRGTHLDHPMVHTQRVRTVELVADGIVGYADGERALPLPVTVTAVPGAVRLLR